jgi:mannose-6-phosphate isomerase
MRMCLGVRICLSAYHDISHSPLDIMECMATSDNVIRAGLTPKLRDVPNLISGLTYISGHHSKHIVEAAPFSEHSRLYNPPVPEFAVIEVQLQGNESDVHRPIEGPSIVSITTGNGTVQWDSGSLPVVTGDVLFMGAGVEVSFASRGDGLTLYRAFVEA